MLVLAIDTATPAVTAGVVELTGDECTQRAVRVTLDARAHVERLMPSVVECLSELGVTASELGAIVCGVGPGPFTGLRAGIATATSFGDALGIPVYPVCTLDAIAQAADVSSELLVVTDARRKELYWARYRGFERVDGPHVGAPDSIPVTANLAVAGPVAVRQQLGLPEVSVEYPDPAGLVAAAASDVRAGNPPAPVVPLYLRRPDAVEQSKAKRLRQLGDLTIERLKPADIADCVRLEKVLFPTDSPWTNEAFASELAAGHTVYFAARNQADQLVGYAGVAALGAGESAESEVHTIAVDPQWQGLGIGRHLLSAMLEIVDRHGGSSFLEVRTDNEPAQALYRSAGYEIVGTRPNYYQPSGADAYTMVRAPR